MRYFWRSTGSDEGSEWMASDKYSAMVCAVPMKPYLKKPSCLWNGKKGNCSNCTFWKPAWYRNVWTDTPEPIHWECCGSLLCAMVPLNLHNASVVFLKIEIPEIWSIYPSLSRYPSYKKAAKRICGMEGISGKADGDALSLATGSIVTSFTKARRITSKSQGIEMLEQKKGINLKWQIYPSEF